MYKEKKILTIIPARGGSKGLPGKNILDFGGKPLITWSIEASLQSEYIDRTIVSTDSEDIAEIARTNGAETPFLRPAELATDEASVYDAIRHCVNWLTDNENAEFDYVLLLQPTSPLRTQKHVDEAIKFYFTNKSTEEDQLVAVKKVSEKMTWLMEKNDQGYVNFALNPQELQRQKVKEYYLPNGAIFFAPTAVWLKEEISLVNRLPFVMDEKVSIDIDSKEDFEKGLKILKTQLVECQN